MGKKIGKYKIGKHVRANYVDHDTNVVLGSTQTISAGGDLSVGTIISSSLGSGSAGYPGGFHSKGISVIAATTANGFSAQDFSDVVADHKIVVSAAFSGSIKLPQATSTNTGMKIDVMVAGSMSGSIGFANSEDTVIDSGIVTLQSLDADKSHAVIVAAGDGQTRKRILVESLSGSSVRQGATSDGENLPGGGEGSRFNFYYAEANKVHVDALTLISNTAENPQLTSSADMFATGSATLGL